MAYDLNPLQLSLNPYESMDSTDTRYLNQSHAPLINSLKKAPYIGLYNDKWFDKLLILVPTLCNNIIFIQFSKLSYTQYFQYVHLYRMNSNLDR